MKELRTCADETLDAKPPAPFRPPEVWEQHEHDGPLPKLPDCPDCVEEHGSLPARPLASTPCTWIQVIGVT